MPRRKRLPRNIYERGGLYYARIRQQDGSWRRVSTHVAVPDVDSACRVRDRLQGQVLQAEAGVSPEAQSHTVEDALAHYVEVCCKDKRPKTQAMYEYAARCIAEELGTLPVNSLLKEDVQRYFAYRLDGRPDPLHPGEVVGKVARSTILKERITLQAALTEAAERGLFVRRVDEVIPEFSFRYTPRRVFLRREDYPALLLALPEHRRFWVRVAIFSGGRDSELEALDWRHDRGTHLELPGTKTADSARVIPIGPELRAVLDEVPEEQRAGKILSRWSNVNRDLRRACAKAGIERITCHDLRRTFGSWLAQEGVSTRIIGALLGHAPGSRMADLTYSHLTDDALRSAVGRLGCVISVPDRPAKAPQKAHSQDSEQKKAGRPKRANPP